MKVLFTIQGEGRGHFTQALSVKQMLEKNGHSVEAVLVGKSASRKLPSFFIDNIGAPVSTFASPNFLPSGRRARLAVSIFYNLLRLPEYIQSVLWLKRTIDSCEADVVINFYELMTGFSYMFLRPQKPQICIGHQYLLLHNDFEVPSNVNKLQLSLLKMFTRVTASRAGKILALSFRSMPTNNNITVVPPLLRSEVLAQKPNANYGDFILGYMLNDGFAHDVDTFHAKHPNANLRFFWDRKSAPDILPVDEHLTFYTINDKRFVHSMAHCKAYATTAGFESVCEAMYLGKPVLMVPVHVEQDCNAFDAAKSGAGVIADHFDLNRLQEFAQTYKPNKAFAQWVLCSEDYIIAEIENMQAGAESHSVSIGLSPA